MSLESSVTLLRVKYIVAYVTIAGIIIVRKQNRLIFKVTLKTFSFVLHIFIFGGPVVSSSMNVNLLWTVIENSKSSHHVLYGLMYVMLVLNILAWFPLFRSLWHLRKFQNWQAPLEWTLLFIFKYFLLSPLLNECDEKFSPSTDLLSAHVCSNFLVVFSARSNLVQTFPSSNINHL